MIFTEYSIWLSVVCAFLAALTAWLLYRNNPLQLDGKYKNIATYTLFGLRFLLVFIVAFLLLGPLLKMVTHQTQKPIVVVGIDQSASLTLHHDTAQLAKQLQSLVESVQRNNAEVDVQVLSIGEKTTPSTHVSFQEKKTNLAAFFETVQEQFDGQNLAGIVLTSDGIYNEGISPADAAKNISVPIYTVALGDSNQKRDVWIKKINVNSLVYKDNLFPVQIEVGAYDAAGKQTKLTLKQDGVTVFEQTLTLSNKYFNTINTTLVAKQKGTIQLTAELSGIDDEISKANNKAEAFIEVVDGKQKIAIVAYTPHPDVQALYDAVSENENYTVDRFIFTQQNVPANLSVYHMVLLHQLPGYNGEGLPLIKQLKAQNIPILYVLGAQNNLMYLNQVESQFQIVGARGNSNEVIPVFQSGFNLFNLNKEEEQIFAKLPPLYAPYGNYRINGEHEILFKQQIGYVQTEYPLVFFLKGSGSKSGFICGEGFWKWRLYDADLSAGKTTSNLLTGMVQYLAGKKDQRKFRVYHKRNFDENETIVFDAELFNESNQLLNTPEVSITIKNSSNKTFRFVFDKTTNAYRLDAGTLPTGVYTYEAKPEGYAAAKPVTGSFTIKPLQIEFVQTRANHQLLNEIATQSNGKSFTLSNANELLPLLNAQQNIKPVIYSHEQNQPWINLKTLFFILLGLASLEWFIRKWNGSI